MRESRQLRAIGMAAAIMFLGSVVCIAFISNAQLKRPTVLKSVTKKAHSKKGDFLLSYLRDNKDVDESPFVDHVHALTPKQVRRAGRSNVDTVGLPKLVGPDGMSDAGDMADVALMNQLQGQLAANMQRADAIDYAHRAKEGTMGFDSYSRTHDMAHAAAAVDERTTLSSVGIAGAAAFNALATSMDRNVDNLGTAADADVFSMVSKATKEPSRQDVHLRRAAREAGLLSGGDAAAGSPEKANLVGALGDSESEMMADPRHDEVEQAERAAQGSSKGVWIEPGSGKNGDSFALDSLQPKDNA